MNLQGSEGWFLDKCGHASASEFSSVLAKGEGKTRATYMRRIVAERLTGKPTETYSNGHMARGVVQEPLARLAYEVHTGEPVIEVGFLKHQKLPRIGCSPDGLVAEDGGIEAKCVIPTVQLATLLAPGGFPSEHRAQIQGNLWVTGRRWWDFVSYSPDMPEHLRLYVFRVTRDEAYIANLEREVLLFDVEAEKLRERLMRMSMTLEEQLAESVTREAVVA